MKINAATHTAQDHKVLHLRWRLLIRLKQRQLSETTEQRQRTTKNEWDRKETNGRRYYRDINIQRNGFAPAHVVVRHKTSIVCIQCVRACSCPLPSSKCTRFSVCCVAVVSVYYSKCFFYTLYIEHILMQWHSSRQHIHSRRTDRYSNALLCMHIVLSLAGEIIMNIRWVFACAVRN